MAERVIELGQRCGEVALLALPGALVVFLAFNAGGFFPDTVAAASVILLLALAARIIASSDPFAGWSIPLAVGAVALGLYALWTLLSAIWSDSTWRALTEFDRALLYLTALALFGSVPREPGRTRWMMRGLAAGIFVVCAIALVTRIMPHVWPVAPGLSSRLSYPITYWNSLGLLAAFGVILCLHLTSSRSEPPVARVAGAGGLPILATTLYFTLSRGAILACIIGVIAYVVLGRPRSLLTGSLAALPPTAIAVVAAYDADRLTGLHPTSSAAVGQGHDVALVLALCTVGAVMLRLGLPRFQPRLDRLRPSPSARRAFALGLAAIVVVAAIGGAVAVDFPHYVSDQYHRFVQRPVAGNPSDPRTRLTDPSSAGRLANWSVAIHHGLDPAKLEGQGAGTFEELWARYRPAKYGFVNVQDAHSLYVESAGELGLVGLLLTVAFVGTILFGFAARIRGPNRTAYAALLAAGIAWAVRAGVDWDWEMPVVTLWFFALGGAALAASAYRRSRRRGIAPWARYGAAAGCLAVGVLPLLIFVSQARLNSAVDAFLQRDDCESATSSARDSASIMPMQPKPYEVEGYCEARNGAPARGARAMAKAVSRDPGDWEYRYGEAVTRAAAGKDPRPAALAARRLNPLDPRTGEIVRRLGGSNAAQWRRQGRNLLKHPIL